MKAGTVKATVGIPEDWTRMDQRHRAEYLASALKRLAYMIEFSDMNVSERKIADRNGNTVAVELLAR